MEINRVLQRCGARVQVPSAQLTLGLVLTEVQEEEKQWMMSKRREAGKQEQAGRHDGLGIMFFLGGVCGGARCPRLQGARKSMTGATSSWCATDADAACCMATWTCCSSKARSCSWAAEAAAQLSTSPASWSRWSRSISMRCRIAWAQG